MSSTPSIVTPTRGSRSPMGATAPTGPGLAGPSPQKPSSASRQRGSKALQASPRPAPSCCARSFAGSTQPEPGARTRSPGLPVPADPSADRNAEAPQTAHCKPLQAPQSPPQHLPLQGRERPENGREGDPARQRHPPRSPWRRPGRNLRQRILDWPAHRRPGRHRCFEPGSRRRSRRKSAPAR